MRCAGRIERARFIEAFRAEAERLQVDYRKLRQERCEMNAAFSISNCEVVRLRNELEAVVAENARLLQENVVLRGM